MRDMVLAGLKDPDAGKNWRQEKRTTEDKMVGWHHWFNGHEFEQSPGDCEGQGSLVCFSSWGRKESDTTERLIWSDLIWSGGQTIGASASASVLPVNIQGWFPLGLTGLISLLSKGLSRVFTSTIIWKHQFFSAQPALWSTSLSTHDYWKNHSKSAHSTPDRFYIQWG